jgi:hypothetical protein
LKFNFSARKVIASIFGVDAGFLSVEHGYFETLQGNMPTNHLLINAIAPQPSNMWQGGEPALTVLPNFLVTGVFAILFGIIVAVWSGSVHRKETWRCNLGSSAFGAIAYGRRACTPIRWVMGYYCRSLAKLAVKLVGNTSVTQTTPYAC